MSSRLRRAGVLAQNFGVDLRAAPNERLHVGRVHRGLDLSAQVGRRVQEEETAIARVDGNLRLRAGDALQRPRTQSPAVTARAVPLRETTPGGSAEDLDSRPY